MNAIVLIALKRPYTFVVLAILIAIFGGLAARRTPTDIFPDVRIPVVAVVWTYTGLTPEDISGRVIYYYERALTTTVDNIEHIESQSLYGRGIVKIFFQPGTDVAAAQAQVTAISQTVLKQLPAGITPPEVLAYNASSVAVLALEVSSKRLTGSQCLGRASASAGRRACGSSTTRASGSGVGVSDPRVGRRMVGPASGAGEQGCKILRREAVRLSCSHDRRCSISGAVLDIARRVRTSSTASWAAGADIALFRHATSIHPTSIQGRGPLRCKPTVRILAPALAPRLANN